jgi:hypothetical protein
MLTFAVAYIRVAGVDLTLVPVAESFGLRPHAERIAATAHLSRVAARGGLSGRVIPVWPGESGRALFFSPPAYSSIVETMTWEFVTDCLNYRVTVARRDRPSGREPVRSVERCTPPAGLVMPITA